MTDFVKIKFILPKDDDGYPPDDVEIVWAVPEASGYRIDNIPFFIRGVSCHDVVAASQRSGELHFERVLIESGHSTIRILVSSEDESVVEQVRQELRARGCTSELSHIPGLVAVDVPPSVKYEDLQQVLAAGESSGRWEYEEACVAHAIGSGKETLP